MPPALDNVFQVNLAILILQVQTPARSLVDIGPVGGLLITDDPMQTSFRKLARPVALLVFEFGQRLQEAQLEIFCWEALSRVINYSPGVEERADAGHLRCSAVPTDLIGVKQVRDGAIAPRHFVVADRTKESDNDSPENRVVIDRYDQPDVAPRAQRVEGRTKATL